MSSAESVAEFQVTFEISPSGRFGLPQEGMTVLSGKIGSQVIGDSYHVDTLTRVGYGTLSQYRNQDESIDEQIFVADARIHIRDNFAFATTMAADSHEALELTTRALDKFLSHVSLSQGGLFTQRPLVLESSTRNVFPLPKLVQIASVTVYNVEQLRKDLKSAQEYAALSDPKLERGIAYYRHALFLFEKRTVIADPLLEPEHYAQFVASVFSNLYKAVSIVVGDPSIPADKDYQRRYKKLGFDYSFFMNKIEKIRNLRNSYDVAHYSLNEEDIKIIEASFGEAVQTVSEVLKRYRDYLKNQAGGTNDSGNG